MFKGLFRLIVSLLDDSHLKNLNHQRRNSNYNSENNKQPLHNKSMSKELEKFSWVHSNKNGAITINEKEFFKEVAKNYNDIRKVQKSLMEHSGKTLYNNDIKEIKDFQKQFKNHAKNGGNIEDFLKKPENEQTFRNATQKLIYDNAHTGTQSGYIAINCCNEVFNKTIKQKAWLNKTHTAKNQENSSLFTTQNLPTLPKKNHYINPPKIITSSANKATNNSVPQNTQQANNRSNQNVR